MQYFRDNLVKLTKNGRQSAILDSISAKFPTGYLFISLVQLLSIIFEFSTCLEMTQFQNGH